MSILFTAMLIASSAAVLVLYWTFQPNLAKRSTVLGERSIGQIIWTGTQFYAFTSALANPTTVTSGDGVTWQILPTGNSPRVGSTEVIWNGTLFLAFSPYPTSNLGVNVSYDGIEWTRVNTTKYYNGIVWTGSMFVAISAARSILKSTDGLTWEQVTLPAHPNNSSTILYSIAWNGSTLCVGSTQGSIWTSTDAVTWTARTGLSSTAWGAKNVAHILWTGSVFFALASVSYATSPDGVTWTYGTTNLSAIFTTNNSCFTIGSTIFVTYGGKFTSSSNNGVSWTAAVGPILGYSNTGSESSIATGAWNGSKYVFTGGSARVATSTDKVTWTEQKNLSQYDTCFGANTIEAMAWNGSKLCVASDGRRIATSPDGITWTYHYNALAGTTINTAAESIDMAASPSKFCLLTQYSTTESKCVTSSDGVTWTEQASFNSVFSGIVTSVIWTGSKFYAVGGVGKAAYSSDGVTWTGVTGLATATVNRDILGIAWNGTVFCAVGYYGSIATSTDGVTWTAQTNLSSNPLWGSTITGHIYSIAWNGSVFCVGGAGKIATSPDGVVWTISSQFSTLNLSNAILRVCFAKDTFYATVFSTDNLILAVSSDGLFWTRQTKLATTDWGGAYATRVVWTGSKTVAAGQYGNIAILK